MAVNMCLPLAKYSHALGMDANKVPWTHITAKDMFVILKGHLLHQSVPLSMTVMQGTSRLDVIDIAARLSEAKQFQASKEQTGSSYEIEQLPFFGLKRNSVLALRYYIDGKPRRIQLALNSVEECDQIVQILSQLGMQFKERPGTSTARPTSKASRGPTSQIENPPWSAHASSYFPTQNAPQPSPFSFPDMEAGSLSQQPPLGFQKPDQPSSSSLLPTKMPKERQTHIPDEYLLPRTISPTRPSTAELWGTSSLQTRLQPSHLQYPSSNLSPSRDTSGVAEPLPPPQGVSSDTIGSEYHTPLHSDRADLPSSAGYSKTSLATLETLEHEIPPKRELPFKVAGSGASNSSRPSSSALSLPPLKRPTTADARPTTATRPKTAASKSLKPASTKVNEGRPSTSHSTSQIAKKPLQPVQSNVSFAAAKRPIQDPEGSANSLSKVARVSSLIDAPHELESPADISWASAQVPADQGKVNGQGTFAGDAISKAYSALSTSHQMQDTSSLEEYAAQDAKSRQTALEQFMVDNLQNPSFTTLCEDMESCWQRIALGL